MHDAWCMMHDAWCMMHDAWCMILDYDACVYDAHIYDPGHWSWSMHLCMVHVSMMRQILSPTNGQGDSRSWIWIQKTTDNITHFHLMLRPDESPQEVHTCIQSTKVPKEQKSYNRWGDKRSPHNVHCNLAFWQQVVRTTLRWVPWKGAKSIFREIKQSGIGMAVGSRLIEQSEMFMRE